MFLGYFGRFRLRSVSVAVQNDWTEPKGYFRSFREKVQSRLIESFLRTLFTNLVKSEVQFPSTGGNGTFPILGILYRRNLFLVVIIFLFLIKVKIS